MTYTSSTSSQSTTHTCECGCGESTTRRFARGHDVRMKAELKRRWRESRDLSALNELRTRGWLDNVKETRKFGVEIEFLVPSQLHLSSLAMEMTARGLTCGIEGYNHNDVNYWKITTDSSVGGSGSTAGWVGRELVSPPLSSKEGKRQLRLACEALAAVGAKVNMTCGLHVHHDARHLTDTAMVRVAETMAEFAWDMDRMVSKSRRGGNTYCYRFDRYQLDMIRAIGLRMYMQSSSRYQTLNLSAYLRHGTIEFRQHQGSVEYDKIVAWVEVGQAMIRAAQRGDSLVGVSFGDLLEWGTRRLAWWERRIEVLNPA